MVIFKIPDTIIFEYCLAKNFSWEIAESKHYPVYLLFNTAAAHKTNKESP